MIGRQLDYGRQMLARLAPALPDGAPKAVIVPHAGYAYSSTTALAYALLERGGGGGRRAARVLGFAALVGELHAGRRPIPVAFIRRPRVAPSECQGPDRVERRIREAGLGGSCRQNGAVAVRRRAVHAVYAVHAVRLSDVFVSVSVAVPRSRSAYQQSTSWMRLRSASLPMARQRAS